MVRLSPTAYWMGVLLWVWTLGAGATTMLREEVTDLSRVSDVVVRGTVRRVESRWTQDRMRIVTEVEISVAETLKGKGGATVKILQPGGQVGDIVQKVSGLASFSQGEEVVVFLERRPGERYMVAGMAQGKFRVERSSDGTAAFAVPEPVGDALVLDPTSRAPTAERHRVLELEEMRRTVRATLQDQPGRKEGQP